MVASDKFLRRAVLACDVLRYSRFALMRGYRTMRRYLPCNGRHFVQVIHSLALMFGLLVSVNVACADVQPPPQAPRLRIEAGMHTAALWSVDVSADGKLLVTGSEDKTVRLWSLPDGQIIRTFRVPVGADKYGKIYAVAISPDGRLVAAGGWDTYWSSNSSDEPAIFIYLFDTVTGALAKRLGPLPGTIRQLQFSPDGIHLVAGLGGSNGILVWSRPFTEKPASDYWYQGDVNAIAVDTSGSGRIATTSYGGMIRLYEGMEVTLAQRKAEKAPGGEEPFGIAFSPDGKTLAVGYADTTKIDLMSVPDLVRIHEVDTRFATKGSLNAVSFSKDGQSLYAGGAYFDAANVVPVMRWPNAGYGAPINLGGPIDTILDLTSLQGGGVVFGSGAPAFGVYGADDKLVLGKMPVQGDMRINYAERFAGAPDATGAWFRLKFGAEDFWSFDVNTLSFQSVTTRPTEYISPVTNTLDIQNWSGENWPSTRPTLDGRPLLSDPYEVSRSLAIAPDAQSFVLGTSWKIHRFDAQGLEMPAYPIDLDSVAWGVNLSADGSIITAALGDGTIRWYRASDGAELLAFFVHVPDNRWIAWTPKGYYAASPGGEDLIGWQVNGKTWDDPVSFYPASLFRSRFYRPDIVQLVLKAKDEARAIDQANIIAKRKSEEVGIDNSLPPVVEIIADPRGSQATTDSIELHYRLRSPSGQAVTRLELRVDGQLVQPRAVEVIDESLTLNTDLVMTVPLPPRDVTVSLTAFIDEQPSVAATMPVKWTGPASAGPKPKLYALLVGVSDYDEPKLKLNYAAKDAADMEAALKRQKGKFFAEVETVVLADRAATENRIQIELSRLHKKVGPYDYAVVFMAGHGVTDAQGAFHFLPADASLAEDELAATSLDGLVIRNILRTMQGKVLLFMDACNAGNAITGDQALADMTGFANDFAQANGVVMYASSTGRQFSYENAQWSNGAFTKALVSTLDDAEAFGKDSRLSIFELAEELSGRVDALTGGLQTPVMTKSAAIPNFHLASVQ